jgi:hypothetical protein
MPEQNRRFAWERRSGGSVAVRDLKLTPEVLTLTMRWSHGGFVWNHPTAVLVERNGVTQRIAIPDVTLVAMLSLAGLAALGGLVLFLSSSQQRRKSYEQRN